MGRGEQKEKWTNSTNKILNIFDVAVTYTKKTLTTILRQHENDIVKLSKQQEDITTQLVFVETIES